MGWWTHWLICSSLMWRVGGAGGDRRSDKQSNCKRLQPQSGWRPPSLHKSSSRPATTRTEGVCERAASASVRVEGGRRMPRRSPRCRAGHFDFSEEVVTGARLAAPGWLFLLKSCCESFLLGSYFLSRRLGVSRQPDGSVQGGLWYCRVGQSMCLENHKLHIRWSPAYVRLRD